MQLGIDMMGGDFAPVEAAKGIVAFLESAPNEVIIHAIGDEIRVIESLQAAHAHPHDQIRVVHAPDMIDMHEHPTKALREKPQSSINVGFHLLASGKLDAFISAGNTGAMLVGSLFSIKAMDGVQRPTIGTYIPREDGTLGVLLDAGINADCKPENLNQFAVLGSLFAEHVLDIPKPRVGLINIGEEEGKGNLLAQATYPLLKENKDIHFIGNIEGRDILLNKADVMVCEGFTGNVVLKMAESIYDLVQHRNIQDEHFQRFNFEHYGGVPVLGVNKPVIIGHGISHAKAFANMIRTAQRMIDHDLIGKMKIVFGSASA
jgi:glycerol-3-phosphate acyltransferase PlsX